MRSLRRLLAYVRPQSTALMIAILCMVVLALTTTVYAFLAGPAIKFVFYGDITTLLRTSSGELRDGWNALPPDWVAAIESLDRTWALMLLPALIVGTALVKGLAQTGQFFALGRISQRLLRAVRSDAFAAMLDQPPAFYADRRHGDLLSRLTVDANLVEQAVFYGVAPTIREPLAIVFLLGFCFYTSPVLALVTFVTVPLAALPLARFARWLKRVARRGQDNPLIHVSVLPTKLAQN
jgi:subfamily B ATP-binding cassette protein MsbA